MRTRALGKSGIQVGEIGLGTWSLSGEGYGPVAPGIARATLEAAMAEGVTFVETAACYGPAGEMEQMLGALLRDRGRDRLFVSTRIGVERNAPGGARKSFRAVDLPRLAEASLARLGVEYVDAFVLHNPLPTTLRGRERPLDVMRQLRDLGRTRLVGVSIGSVEAGRAALDGGADFLVLPYNLLYPKLLHELAGDIASAGAGVVVRSPLAYGVLAGTWTAERKFEDGDHRNDRWGPSDLARRVRQRDAMRFLVHGHVKSLREAAIRYVLSNALVSVVVVGARTPEQAIENAHAADELPYLPDEDLNQIATRMREEGIDY